MIAYAPHPPASSLTAPSRTPVPPPSLAHAAGRRSGAPAGARMGAGMNIMIRDAIAAGEKEFELDNIGGQRYIGDGINETVKITINGTPGNDLAAFMNGPKIIVNANAQDGIANTMNAGEIIIHGNVGDIIGYGMRGGKLYIRGDAGYRVGIHMKEYKKQVPIIITGGTAGDFFGEC